jgi:transposase InsO family protein
MNQIYKALNYSKQSFHKKLEYELQKASEFANLTVIINQIREDHPTLSARKMYFMLNLQTMGRDSFERFCMLKGYGVPRKRNFHKTTNSLGVVRFNNLIAGRELTGTNQVWVSDITYYRMGDKFYYLSFIMDLFSRKIIGFSVSKDLKTINTTLVALKMAKRERSHQKVSGCIFHSDGGGQYYQKDFIDLTKEMGLVNSMGYSVFENPHAERINGTIKNNYLLHYSPNDYNGLIKQVTRAVRNYNNRPHDSLGQLSPNTFEQGIREGHLKAKMNVSNFKECNPFDFIHKDKVDPEPVKGKINGAAAQCSASPPLTEPVSTFYRGLQNQKE